MAREMADSVGTGIPKFLLLPKNQGFLDSLSGAEHSGRRQCHLLPVWGDDPAILVGDLIASSVG
jgi:hypothetical protein